MNQNGQRIGIGVMVALAVFGAFLGLRKEGAARSLDEKTKLSQGAQPCNPPARSAGAPSQSVLAAVEALMGPDSPTSLHPVESAVAKGKVLATRIEKVDAGSTWSRTRLVQTANEPRLKRVIESWLVDFNVQSATCLSRYMYLADQIVVKAAHGVSDGHLKQKLAEMDMRVDQKITDGLFTVRLAKAEIDTVPEAVRVLARHPELAAAADPDCVGFGTGIPNDYRFLQWQWALYNTGQYSEDGKTAGTVGVDVNASKYWDIVGYPTNIVIAVLDSGMVFSNADLKKCAWRNPGEIPWDGVDNDGNGKIDDTNGWDYVNNDNNPADDLGHGSNVAGIIAATRNDGFGIAGLLSGAKILICKVINSANEVTASNLLAAMIYARQFGVPVMNLSVGNFSYWAPMYDELTACEAAGIVMCIAAANNGSNNDVTPNFPSSYAHSNIISVGNHDRTGARYTGSNYGYTSVDLFAPGTEIWAPYLGVDWFNWYTGTSQAAPFVAAVSGAIKHINPSWTATQIKACILNSVVTSPSFSGLCVTGGRLDAAGAVSYAIRQLPSQDTDGDGTPNLFEYLAGTLIDSPSSKPAITNSFTDGYVRIGMQRVPQSDAHLVVEKSTNLVTWTTSGVTDFSSTSNLLGGISYSDGPCGFLRIRAVTP